MSFLTLKQVAAYLKIHEATVYHLANQGKLPMFRVGAQWRARQEDIDNLFKGKP